MPKIHVYICDTILVYTNVESKLLWSGIETVSVRKAHPAVHRLESIVDDVHQRYSTSCTSMYIEGSVTRESAAPAGDSVVVQYHGYCPTI
jgi:hypothetical protein